MLISWVRLIVFLCSSCSWRNKSSASLHHNKLQYSLTTWVAMEQWGFWSRRCRCSNLLLVSSWTFNRCTFSSIPVTFVEQIHWEAFQHYKTQRIWKLVLVGRYVSTPTFAILYGESWFLLDEKTTCAFSDWTSAPRTLFSLWEEIIIQKMSEIIHVFNFQTKESPAVGSSQCSLSLSASDSATPKKLPWFFFS